MMMPSTFKKTLPAPGSASFVQVTSNEKLRKQALEAVQKARGDHRTGSHSQLDLLALALTGKKVDFGKVIKMIDEMVDVLKQEQQDDSDKLEYCQKQFDSSDDKKKELEHTVEDLETALEAAESGIATLKEEMGNLEASIKALDKSVAEASEVRKEENQEYKELMASDGAAKQLLGVAKNRLNKFYNPKLYKPPAKEELSAQERIAVNMGGAAFVQVSSSRKEAPPPPPATWDAYAKKGEESTGVIAMIDLLIKDLDKEMTEAETQEKVNQEDYEKMMADSAEERAMSSKMLAAKAENKAGLESDLQTKKGQLKSTTRELMATQKYIMNLHTECDWLMQYFDVRKEARDGEIDSLKNAKAVLSGASYSFLQETANFLRR
jgi:septal ring factor EnvC (AmiA/AmiB activator)